VEQKGYNHTDYMWDSSAAELVYPSVIEFAEKNRTAVNSMGSSWIEADSV
jgi:hypothetical protein